MRSIGCIGVLLAGFLSGMWMPDHTSAGAAAHSLDLDRVAGLEEVLKQAAVKSPRWHSKQTSIQRDISDISYLMEQAVKASQASNHTAMREYARHALALLKRAVTRGHFNPEDVAPVVGEIQRLLPNATL